MKPQVIITWKEGLHFEAQTPGGVIELDGNPEFGGQGKGVRPKALMLDALAGCMGMDVASLMAKMRADKEVEDFRIEIAAEMTEEHPKYYKEVWIAVKFKGKKLKRDKLEKAVHLSRDRYCGVYKMFSHFATLHLDIVFEED